MLINNSNFQVLLLLLSVFFFKVIKSQNELGYYYGETNFKIKDIKDLKITILSNTSDNSTDINCPEYSSGPRVIYTKESDTNPTGEIKFCDVSFACNENKCVYYKSPYNTYMIKDGKQYGIPYKKEGDANNKKLFIHACSLQNELCFTDTGCQKDGDCFSNNCKQGRCIVDKDKAISLCRIKRNVTDELHLDCKLNVNEFCMKSDKCYTNKCNNNYQICFDENANYKIKFQKLFYVFIGLILLFALSCILYIYSFRDKLFSHFDSQTDSSIIMNETSNSNNRNSRHNNNNDDDDSDIVFNNIYYHN